MSVKKFKFVSPGVFIDEIDNSGLPAVAEGLGPVIIGRAARGPGMRPVKVDSFSDFVEVFGSPVPGGQGGDIWRDGNTLSPMYGTYAAQAWLRNSAPLTFVRLLGHEHTNKTTGAGEAGWVTRYVNTGVGDASAITTVSSTNGGAYGLFVVGSGSNASCHHGTGTLAAVWYVGEGSIELSGSEPVSGVPLTGTNVLVKNETSGEAEFRVIIKDQSGNVTKNTLFNFNKNSDKWARSVFNTNPTLTNPSVTNADSQETYWLGETFEKAVSDDLIDSSTGITFAGNDYIGFITGLAEDGGTPEWGDRREAAAVSKTGWFISQDLRTSTATGFSPHNRDHTNKLFRLKSLDDGGWANANIKVSIQDIKASTSKDNPYGTFSVVIRHASDNDGSVRVMERFTGLNLNPNSVSYIGRAIGDAFVTWDETEKRYIDKGNYENRSKFVYVEMNSEVDTGQADASLLPFGVYGPPRVKGFTLSNATRRAAGVDGEVLRNVFNAGAHPKPFIEDVCFGTKATGSWLVANDMAAFDLSRNQAPFSASFKFPTFSLRSGSDDPTISSPKAAYFGYDSRESKTTTRFANSNIDIARSLPKDINAASYDETGLESWIFTLDDLTYDGTNATYTSGSRHSGLSLTAQSSSWKAVLSKGFDKFTSPMWGGRDGLDVLEPDPFNNTDMASATEKGNSSFYSVKKAIDSLSDPEVVEFNLASAPGIWDEALTGHLVNTCEDRGDALAIIDLKTGYKSRYEGTAEALGSVTTAVDNLRDRGINSSYGCAYYPWVQIRDNISNSILWAPPSIAALGTFSSSERKSELWFAPAGFTRGGLTEGSAGVPVVNVRERLTSKDRDKLYEANINPIATFPAEGIVMFGQKTLQVTESALDRINVRRLLIFTKKEISRLSATTLFEQNTKQTWANFLGRVVPFLDNVKSRMGLTDYKVVLDESTTTDELVDRNIMYAKIYLKPARAIEFIALDFVITNTGAAFED